MSVAAMTWAIRQRGLKPSVKFILVMMADGASESGLSFLSRNTLRNKTGYADDDTITVAQKELIDLGLIADTGKKAGKTGTVKIYQFHPDACSEEPEPEYTLLFNSRPNPPLEQGVIAGKQPGNSRVIAGSAGSTYIEGTRTITREQTPEHSLKQKRLFQIPTFEEMETHARKIEMPVTEINKFFNHHNARGWKFRGNVPMKCWKSAMVTWRDNMKSFSPSTPAKVVHHLRDSNPEFA